MVPRSFLSCPTNTIKVNEIRVNEDENVFVT